MNVIKDLIWESRTLFGITFVGLFVGRLIFFSVSPSVASRADNRSDSLMYVDYGNRRAPARDLVVSAHAEVYIYPHLH